MNTGYEFARLADIEVAESVAETANVLIEDSGVIKKTPKSAIGGNTKYDAVIELNDNTIKNIGPENIVIPAGTYQAVSDKLNNGDIPKIVIKHSYSMAVGSEVSTLEVNSSSSDSVCTIYNPSEFGMFKGIIYIGFYSNFINGIDKLYKTMIIIDSTDSCLDYICSGSGSSSGPV